MPVILNRSKDLEMGLGYSYREVELFEWLEVPRGKQCDDRPCELGLPVMDGGENKGGCPVKIHISEVLHLMGEGKLTQALELIKESNPLPNSLIDDVVKKIEQLGGKFVRKFIVGKTATQQRGQQQRGPAAAGSAAAGSVLAS